MHKATFDQLINIIRILKKEFVKTIMFPLDKSLKNVDFFPKTIKQQESVHLS